MLLLLGCLLLPDLLLPALAAGPELWCGHLDYGKFAKGAPLNISFDSSGAATVGFIFDVDAGGTKCRPQIEPGLKVTRNATHMVLAGTSSKDFYSFEGAIDGDNVTGWLFDPRVPATKIATFTAVKNGPPVVNGEPFACISGFFSIGKCGSCRDFS